MISISNLYKFHPTSTKQFWLRNHDLHRCHFVWNQPLPPSAATPRPAERIHFEAQSHSLNPPAPRCSEQAKVPSLDSRIISDFPEIFTQFRRTGFSFLWRRTDVIFPKSQNQVLFDHIRVVSGNLWGWDEIWGFQKSVRSWR
jgi:hypothetical protein